MSEQIRRRMTPQMRTLLQAILNHPAPPMYGYDLMRLSGLESGLLYPALSRLEEQGYLSSCMETIDSKKEGRAPRRVYLLTGEGRLFAQQTVLEQSTRTGGLNIGGVAHA